MRTLVIVMAAALVGGYAYNKWVSPLVPHSDGFGIDDIAFAGTVAAAFYVGHKVARKVA